MNILVVGSGGREHAICHSFSLSTRVSRLICANGNAGIASIAECIPIGPDEIDRLADFAKSNEVDLTFIGGETALAKGVVNVFERRGLRIVGPGQAAARLESSKAFSKDFMARHQVPTAAYFVAESAAEAVSALNRGVFGGESSAVVVKADGLAAGKGVVVAKDRREALEAITDLEAIAGAEAASRIVLEEFLEGREVSLIMFADGEDFSLMPPTRDHKRIGEGDTGPNTGGMGTITDEGLLTPEQRETIIREIVRPTLKGCVDEGFPFRGILFLGLMMTADGPKVLEYNVRFGDPETQSILVRLETDLVDICEAMLEGKLAQTEIKWRPGNSATVVLAASGYPQSPKKGDIIRGVEDAVKEPGVTVFHSGTSVSPSGDLITAGGRVLSITATGDSLDEALDRSYGAIAKITWAGMQFRRDIGK